MAVTYTPTASFQTAGTETLNACYKDVAVTVGNGDLLVAFGCSENANGSGTAALATQSGSTGSWTVSASNNLSNSPGYVMGYAQASAGGSVTVRITVPTSGGASLMGGGVWVIPAGQWSGTPAVTTLGVHDTDGKVSVTMGATSTVIFGGADWSALAPGSSVTPSGSADSVWSDGVHYAGLLAEWVGQAAGTRAYGPVSPAGDDWAGAVLVVQGDASGGGGGTPQDTADLWASGTPTTAQSNGSWSGAANAAGTNNATFATWTSTGSGATGSIIPAAFGAQAAIGSAPASVNSVTVTVYGYVTNTTRMSSIAVQLADNGTVFGTPQTMTKTTTTTNSQTFVFTGVTWAQLANLGVRVLFTRGAVTTAANGLVDAVKIVVNYTPASTTPVSSSRSTTWATKAVVQSSRSTQWATLVTLIQVASSRATSWRTLSSSEASRATTWRTAATATSGRATSWRTLSQVAAARASSWAVLGQIAASRATSWRTLAEVAASRATQWAVQGLASVASSRSTTWRTLGQAASSRATTWDLLVEVTSSRSTTWDALAAAASSRATSWRTLSSASSARATTWDLLAAVAVSSRSTSWRTLGQASSSRATSWEVFSPPGQVQSSRGTSWRVLAAVVPSSRQTSWDTLVARESARGTSWRTLLGISASRDTAWRSLATASSSRAELWRVLEEVSSARSTTWTVDAAAFGSGHIEVGLALQVHAGLDGIIHAALGPKRTTATLGAGPHAGLDPH